MKKRIIQALVLSVALLSGRPSAASPLIFVNPQLNSVLPGGSVSVSLVISGLGASTAPSLGTFDLDISFDPGVLAFTGFTFGGPPPFGDQLDLGFGSYAEVIPGIGTVNLFELSLASVAGDLDSLQMSSFPLGTLGFRNVGGGRSAVSISINQLGDALGAPLPFDTRDGLITVTPEPGTILLLASGMLLLSFAMARRRRGGARRTVATP